MAQKLGEKVVSDADANPFVRMQAALEDLERSQDSLAAVGQIQEQLAELQQSIAEIYETPYFGTDETESVEASVDGHGIVKSLTITARGMQQHDNESLAYAVTEAVRAATESMAAGVAESFQGRLGLTPEVHDIDKEALLNTRFDGLS
jgi:DNA-binding protein YbaB